jgi:cytochrome c oxidase subunit IV
MNAAANPYAIYKKTWIILLIITIAMLASEAFHLPRFLLVIYLVAFMLVKAGMIGGNFMHLRFENTNLALMVVAGLLVTSLILFLFITPETVNVLAKLRATQ